MSTKTRIALAVGGALAVGAGILIPSEGLTDGKSAPRPVVASVAPVAPRPVVASVAPRPVVAPVVAHGWDPRSLRPCPTEDSSRCYWDATKRGNGEGRSFWVDGDGNAHYLSR